MCLYVSHSTSMAVFICSYAQSLLVLLLFVRDTLHMHTSDVGVIFKSSFYGLWQDHSGVKVLSMGCSKSNVEYRSFQWAGAGASWSKDPSSGLWQEQHGVKVLPVGCGKSNVE